MATKLAAEGARVVINDRDAEPVEEAARALRNAGGDVLTCAGSVTDDGFAERFVEIAVERLGGLDIIVNNAGYTLA